MRLPTRVAPVAALESATTLSTMLHARVADTTKPAVLHVSFSFFIYFFLSLRQ